MKKAFLLVIIVLLLLVIVAILMNYRAEKSVQRNNIVTKEIIKMPIPDGYSTIKAYSSPDRHERIAILSGTNEYAVILVEGELLSSEADKNELLSKLQKYLQRYNTGKYINIAEITPENHITVNEIKYPKYRILLKSGKQVVKGILVFLNYRDRTVLFICFARNDLFNERTGIEFLKKIKLPDTTSAS